MVFHIIIIIIVVQEPIGGESYDSFYLNNYG